MRPPIPLPPPTPTPNPQSLIPPIDDEVEAEWVQDEAPDPRVFLKSINVPKILK